jgi:hypothetical protein
MRSVCKFSRYITFLTLLGWKVADSLLKIEYTHNTTALRAMISWSAFTAQVCEEILVVVRM